MSREHLDLAAAPSGARILAHGSAAVQQHLLEHAYRQGERSGRQAAAELLEQAVAAIEAGEDELRQALGRTTIELALEITRTLLRVELPAGRYDLERIVRETLHESGVGRNPCVVHLNPSDHASLSEVRFRSGTRLEPDEGVARGDVHVETSLGLLVRSLDGALESIARRLQEELA